MNCIYYKSSNFVSAVKALSGKQISAGSTRCVNYNEKCCLIHFNHRIEDYWRSVDGSYYVDPDHDLVYSDFELEFSEEFSALRSKNKSLIIYCDHLFVGNSNNTISYVFSCLYNGWIHTFIYFVFTDVVHNLSLDYMLGRIFDVLGFSRLPRRNITSYKYIPRLDASNKPVVEVCSTLQDALKKGVYAFIDGSPSTTTIKDAAVRKLDNYRKYSVFYDFSEATTFDVTLLVNHGLDFFSSVDRTSANCFDVLDSRYNVRCFDSSLLSKESISRIIGSYDTEGYNYAYLPKFTIRDVAALSCGLNNSSLPEIYGKLAGCIHHDDFAGTKFGSNFKKCLDDYLKFSPKLYMLYAIQSGVDVLIYVSRLCGINQSVPYTFTSRACDVAVNYLTNFYGCKTKADFLSNYAGLCRKNSGLKLSATKKFYRNSSYAPLNEDCEEIQRFASMSFAGGYNGCFSVDCHHDFTTYDIDIPSAYPTSMCLVPAIDYSNPIEKRYRDEDLSLDEFIIDGEHYPMCPIFALITYEFPSDCKFPNLRRRDNDDDEAPCYPLKETEGVYCSGPEIYLALLKGAKIHVKFGVKCRLLRNNDGTIIYPYRDLVKALVNARTDAAVSYGKKSLPALFYKFVVNTLYGKIAQHVKKMYSHENADYHESEITNNAAASLITSFVRSVLFAAFDGIDKSGYRVYSATTDGLITDMPFDDFIKLPLSGFSDFLLNSRKIITGEENPDSWSLKHVQDDLLNFTTRGNASLITEDAEHGILGGVIAKNGITSKFPELPKEAEENRAAFILAAVSRTDKIQSSEKRYTSINDVRNNIPYTSSHITKNISLDFDMKRKPIESTLKAEYYYINDQAYEIATFETEPYTDTQEYLFYKNIAERQACLRTVDDMKRFFADIKCELEGVSSGSRDGDSYMFKKLMSCIMAYRAKEIEIPYLDTPNLTVNDKIAWIQSNNPSKNHTFNKKSWDKTSEKKRQEKRLPYEVCKDIHEMLLKASPVADEPTEKSSTDKNSVADDIVSCTSPTKPVCESKESASANTAPCVSSVTVSKSVEDKSEKFYMFNGIKIYYDENEALLDESLKSEYYDNPYSCDYNDDTKCSETLEIYDGEIFEFPDDVDDGNDYLMDIYEPHCKI